MDKVIFSGIMILVAILAMGVVSEMDYHDQVQAAEIARGE